MNTDRNGVKHQDLTRKIIRVFFEVYNELGSGFLETVYVEALALALHEAGLKVDREMPLSVCFRDKIVGQFRADLIVNGAVLVETKACAYLQAAHKAQILNYLRATVLEVGLLLNFGPRPVIRRFLFDNTHKTPRRTRAGQSTAERVVQVGTISSHPC